MKVVLIEPSHWHFPLYRDAIKKLKLDVIGVSDKSVEKGKKIADQFGCAFFENFHQLVKQKDFDFAFAFGRHVDMPAIGESLIKKGTPFAMEKPCGTKLEDVKKLRLLAEKQNQFVAIPFIFRCSDLYEEIRKYERTIPSDFKHMCFRFIAGSPTRYEEAQCHWMLDRRIAGGGCTINLAVHFVDFFLLMTGGNIKTVYAQMSCQTHHKDIEDYSLIVLTTDQGAVGVVETGYTFLKRPGEQREACFSFRSGKNYYRISQEAARVISSVEGVPEGHDLRASIETDDFYPVFVERTIDDFRKSRKPLAGLRDMERVMNIIDAAYASAVRGLPISLGEGDVTFVRNESSG